MISFLTLSYARNKPIFNFQASHKEAPHDRDIPTLSPHVLKKLIFKANIHNGKPTNIETNILNNHQLWKGIELPKNVVFVGHLPIN